MLFNSISFLVFYPCVFILYWVFKKNIRLQNQLLLVSSFYFYASWNWKFLFLLTFTIVLDYVSGILIEKNQNHLILKRIWMFLSVGINVGFLGVFKYYNFFVDSFATLFGVDPQSYTLNLILPVGISFYTFHGLSYVIDIYKNRIQAERNFVDYALFVSYFPLLVAGPIERATHLLPQLKKIRFLSEEKVKSALLIILLGFFKKIVIADNLAFFVNQIFEDPETKSSTELFFGMVFFSFQIYGDFSGYSDIATGISRLLGIELLKNFNFPYFATSIPDFWKRWHISLTSWFRDYIYIPLGGSKNGKFNHIKNIFIIFLISGFWHGANWTFVFWGFINAVFFLPSLVNLNFLRLSKVIAMMLTFLLISIFWIFFRAESIEQAFMYLNSLVEFSSFNFGILVKTNKHSLLFYLASIAVFYLIYLENKNHNLRDLKLKKIEIFILLFMIFYFGSFKNNLEFIYFQF